MAFKLENLWFALVFLTIVMTFGFNFLGSNLSTYNVTGDSTKLGAVSSYMKTSYDDTTLDMKGKLTGKSISENDAVNNMVSAGYTAARNNPFTVLGLTLNATQLIIAESGLIDNDLLPLYFIISTILTIAVIWAIIYLIMRYRAQ